MDWFCLQSCSKTTGFDKSVLFVFFDLLDCFPGSFDLLFVLLLLLAVFVETFGCFVVLVSETFDCLFVFVFVGLDFLFILASETLDCLFVLESLLKVLSKTFDCMFIFSPSVLLLWSEVMDGNSVPILLLFVSSAFPLVLKY